MDLNLLQTFCKVAELGSFTKAARQLRQPKSRISRAIAQLEAELNLHLIRRTTRQMALTEAGKALFQRSYHLLEALNSEVSQLSESRSQIAGTLRIAAPEDFGLAVLGPLLPGFLELHPDIRFELLFSNAYLDLVAQAVDVAFRIGPLEASSLIQRKLGSVEVILAASPQYLDTFGRPAQAEDLQRFKLLGHQLEQDDTNLWTDEFPAQPLTASITSNHFSLLLQLALQHQGIATLPDFIAYQALKSGALERVLPEWASAPIPLHLLYPPTRRMPAKTRSFIDYIAAESKVYLAANQLG